MREKEVTQKINVQIWTPLNRAIRSHLNSMHIKRDAYLNKLLRMEIERLDSEVQFKMPDAATQHLRKRLKELEPNRTKMTISLDIDLVNRINAVLEKKGILRDSFVNRVLYFLIAKPIHLEILGINFEHRADMRAIPLFDAKDLLFDPFYEIREHNDGRFYTHNWFPDSEVAKAWPNLFGFNCTFSEKEWKTFNIPIEDLLVDYFPIESGERK